VFVARAAVDALLYLLDDGFEGGRWHSLIGNLRAVTPDEWRWVPPGGSRSVAAIVHHVGVCKLMYANHAFGDASLTWESVEPPKEATAEPSSALVWRRTAQSRLRAALAALDDADLLALRRANWGERCETRWLIATMIQHDLYHAGEINHLRSLRGDDWWEHERESSPAALPS
jgi:uncharacterized damage-inducible protein DinB